MKVEKHRFSRTRHYLLLLLSLAVLFVTQVAIPAPCTLAGTITPLGDTVINPSGSISLPEGETAQVALNKFRSQCAQCTNIEWRIIRQGRAVNATIEEVGDDLIVTFKNEGGAPPGSVGDTVYIEGSFDDPVGENPITGGPIVTVRRTIRTNILFRTR